MMIVDGERTEIQCNSRRKSSRKSRLSNGLPSEKT